MAQDERMAKSAGIGKRLAELVPELVARFPAIDVLYLFGSRAPGRAGEDSDVDLAVFMAEEAIRSNPCLDLEIGLFAEGRLGCPVDLVVMQRVSPITQHQVLAHGQRLFERDPGRRVLLESVSFKKYLDAKHFKIKRHLAYCRGSLPGRDPPHNF